MNRIAGQSLSVRVDGLLASGTGLAALLGYLACLSPTVGPGDSGELTLAALKLGIAHPPGYPLFTWLGRLVSLFPVEPALATNFLTALIGAAASSLLYLAGRGLGLGRASSAVASLGFAFSSTFWQQATSHEVYGLNILFLSLLLFTFARADSERAASFLLGCYLFGLVLAHQPTALFWVPALVWLIISRPGSSRLIGLLLPGSLLLILGFSSSLGILFRAMSQPDINWGDPSTLGRFLSHITGQQYRELAMAAPLSLRLSTLPRLLIHELGLPTIILAVLGAIHLSLRSRALLWVLLFLFATGLFGLAYQVPDYSPQMLPALLALCLIAGAAADLIEQALGRAGQYLAVLLLAAPGFSFFLHLPAALESRTTAVRDLAENLLNSLPENAVLLAGADVTANSVRYLQVTNRLRQDVLVVSADMLFAPTYHQELSRHLPLPDYETMLRLAGTGSRAVRKQSLIDQLVRSAIAILPVYLAIELLTPELFSGPLLKQFRIVPLGIVFQVTPKEEPLDSTELLSHNRGLWARYRLGSIQRRFSRAEFGQIQLVYAGSRNNLGMFCYEQGWIEPALEYLKLALAIPAPAEFYKAVNSNLERVKAGIH
ncbi:MAG: DUF2723 domain-containing protein [candidate division WOR-3 bacterium]